MKKSGEIPIHYIFDFPEDLVDHVGSGALFIELDVNIGDIELLRYNEGSMYELIKDSKDSHLFSFQVLS